jgi:hypothetical protein
VVWVYFGLIGFNGFRGKDLNMSNLHNQYKSAKQYSRLGLMFNATFNKSYVVVYRNHQYDWWRKYTNSMVHLLVLILKKGNVV